MSNPRLDIWLEGRLNRRNEQEGGPMGPWRLDYFAQYQCRWVEEALGLHDPTYKLWVSFNRRPSPLFVVGMHPQDPDDSAHPWVGSHKAAQHFYRTSGTDLVVACESQGRPILMHPIEDLYYGGWQRR